MHSHVVEFLAAVFACFNVLSIIARRCLKSLKVKSEVQILFKLSRFRKWNTHTVQQTLGITKKKWVIKEQNLPNLCLNTLMFRNEHWWNLIISLAWHVIESLHKEESSLIFSAKKLFALVKSLFHKQRVYYQKSTNIQQSFHSGHCATLYREGLKCREKFA